MKRFLVFLCVLGLVIGMAGPAAAFFIDFEDGVDGQYVNDIVGVSFQDFNGYDAIYSDIRTGAYNATSDDMGVSYGGGAYHMYGYFSVWAGPNADARGTIVDFTNDDGTWFTTGYAANATFYVDAFLTDGSTVTVTGAANLNSPMSFLTVNATSGTFIDYIVLHDTGNFWIVDNMSGDASGVSSVPEPGTMLLLGSGLISLCVLGRRKFFK